MGDVSYERAGPHVRVCVDNNGLYARYMVNPILGRLDCPAEPRLLYLKAQLHACTSFVLSDPLTGRTGTEEALHCLTSAQSQPWMPLGENAYDKLRFIAALTPRREFYPSDLKVMQRTLWDPHLTTTIQFDGFRAVVESIIAKSDTLSAFSQQVIRWGSVDAFGSRHLTERSQLRRQTHHRHIPGLPKSNEVSDMSYEARDGWRNTFERRKVFEISHLVQLWPSKLSTTYDLAGMLEEWPNTGGNTGSFDKILLSDLLNLDLPLHWGNLVDLCQHTDQTDSHKLMFLVGVMAFGRDASLAALRTLVGFAVLEKLKQVDPPRWALYSQFRRNETPTMENLVQLMKNSLVPYPRDARSIVSSNLDRKQRQNLLSAEQVHKQQQVRYSETLASFLLHQWPCVEPTIDDFESSSSICLINIEAAMTEIRTEWLRLFQNLELSGYLDSVQAVLDESSCDDTSVMPANEPKQPQLFASRVWGGESVTLTDLFSKTGRPIPGFLQTPLSQFSAKTNSIGRPNGVGSLRIPSSAQYGFYELRQVIDSVMSSTSRVHQAYGQDLMNSLEALRRTKNDLVSATPPVNKEALPGLISAARTKVQENFEFLCESLERNDTRAYWLKEGGLFPVLSAVSLLENLRTSASCDFGQYMKQCLLSYAVSITKLQRLLRLDDTNSKSQKAKFEDEQKNIGHANWSPEEYPDWLLLEIDCNMLIRPNQVEVARATISPESKANAVLQMNMGQGKTSCIIPMVATVLANKRNLHRVVVPKALLAQTAQLLQERLGGLLGREVCHIPFSRKTQTNSNIIGSFHKLHMDTQNNCGVILANPEHLLSFSLSGLQRLSDGRLEEARVMIRVQQWLAQNSRDVLDECDNILAIRTQLIYPSGAQSVLDGHPYRWEIVETVLKRVDGQLWNLHNDFPQSLEVLRRFPGAFPIAFFLRKDVEDELLVRLVEDVFRGRAATPITQCNKAQRIAIKQFISKAKVSSEVAQIIQDLRPDNPAIKQSVHLLRGLFVHRILLMALKKRWNVQYGLHPGRVPISVPFTAKGTPSEQAEWGHPDVAVILTCLSFYYGGLTQTQMQQSLEHVLKSDDPSQAYSRFVQNSKLPDSLREWNAINVDDEAQLKHIYLFVRYDVGIIDYYLNNFVFLRHAKQFQLKLQASGWDLPLFSTDQRVDQNQSMTTGFSGTNDWKRMLPLTIEQHDLPILAQTNAEVMTYLLDLRNRQYKLAADFRGARVTEVGLLQLIKDKQIRVLIDAGAQILEMDNLTLVKKWLEIDVEAPAAVYFGDLNKPFVYYRNEQKIPLLATPYADDLGDCLVYIDEAHTRGTDLKIPANARGALTLGLGQTKDHNVQAAMRLRQLGTTQSVVYFAPPEVNQSILDLRKKKNPERPGSIDSFDVLSWLLEQTCNGIEQLLPLDYAQGTDFCRRVQAALDYPQFLSLSQHQDKYISTLRQAERQTLEQLYGVGGKTKASAASIKLTPKLAVFKQELDSRRKGFVDTGDAVHATALEEVEVEVEREVAYEVENVREVQKPIHYKALKFLGLDEDLKTFVKNGRLPADSKACVEAFVMLGNLTAIGRKHGINILNITGNLLVSQQFTKTVEKQFDEFLRPVNWILYGRRSSIAILVMPEEAELLLEILQNSPKSQAHLISYAAPVTRKMLHFNALNYYTVPNMEWEAPIWLRVELGIFAGCLYFGFDEYEHILDFLSVTEEHGVIAEEGESDEDEEKDGNQPKAVSNNSFTRKPLSFMQEWLTLRRKGQDFTHTPMGFICQGKPLAASHPFFTKPEEVERNAHAMSQGTFTNPAEVEKEEEDSDVEDHFCLDDGYGDIIEGQQDTFDDRDLVDEAGDENDDFNDGASDGWEQYEDSQARTESQ